jgi:hypothetical protein
MVVEPSEMVESLAMLELLEGGGARPSINMSSPLHALNPIVRFFHEL